jgi:hypothetical protein
MKSETLKLYDELKRLLEYSGKTVQGISLTVDGAVGTVSMNGSEYAIFVTTKIPRLKIAK